VISCQSTQRSPPSTTRPLPPSVHNFWTCFAGTHEALLDTTPQQTTSRSRQRVFSLGLNAIQMPDLLCGGPCNNAGVGYVSLVVQCQARTPL
jgi:hypothetical protein